jgi:hypothetical protein
MSTATTRRLAAIEASLPANATQPARPAGFEPENISRLYRAVQNGEAIAEHDGKIVGMVIDLENRF